MSRQYPLTASGKWDVTLTSGAANTMGTWTAISGGAGLGWVIYRLIVRIASVTTSGGVTAATTLNAFVDIGIGPNSGAVTTVIERLAASNCYGMGVVYDIPIQINCVSDQLWARHQNTAASATMGIKIEAYGSIREPGSAGLIRKVVSIGHTDASTTGTAITPGAGTAGAVTQIVASSAERYMGLMASPLFNVDTSLTSGLISTVDVWYGSAGTEKLVGYALSHSHLHSASETKDAYCRPVLLPIAAGTRLAANANGSTTADSTNSLILYGMLGG